MREQMTGAHTAAEAATNALNQAELETKFQAEPWAYRRMLTIRLKFSP